MRSAVGAIVLLGLCLPESALSMPCSGGGGPVVLLRAGPEGVAISLEEVGRLLAAASGMNVCIGDGPEEKRVAEVAIERESAGDFSLRITLKDDITIKTLERPVNLSRIPGDSRAVAVALYIEELLQASWAELALEKRVYLREHPATPPLEVKREVDSVLPARAATSSERRLHLSVGGTIAKSSGGLLQAGPDLFLGAQLLPWLEAGVRLGYRVSPEARAPHGMIDSQAVVAGAGVDFVRPLVPGLTLHLPQSFDTARVTFTGTAAPGAQGSTASRFALSISHGAGLRLGLGKIFSLSAVARFCWTPHPAEASDDRKVIIGVSGVGVEGGITVDTHF